MNDMRIALWAKFRTFLSIAAIAALALLVAAPVSVAAQEASPTAEEAMTEGVTYEFLAQAVAGELPAAPAAVGLYRITISPGTTEQVAPGPGVELVLLESGSLVLDFEGPATIVRAGEAGTEAPDEEVTLNAGDAFLASGGDFTVRNDSDEPAQVVGTGVFPMMEEEEESADEMDTPGITYQPLVLGVTSDLPQEEVALALLRVTLEPGLSFPPEEPHPGPELIFMESGTIAVTVTAGELFFLRAGDMATPGAEMEGGELAVVGEELTFGAGDAIFAHTGSTEDVRNTGDEPAVALVGIVVPAGFEEGEHAEAEEATPVP